VVAGKIKKVDITGGSPQTIADVSASTGGLNLAGGTWNRDGMILIGAGLRGILGIDTHGGSVSEIRKPPAADGGTFYVFPWFLPDGRQFVFSKYTGDPSTSALFLGSLDSPLTRRLTADYGQVQIAEGHLLFPRERSLLAQPFDVTRGELVGDPTTITDTVETSAAIGGRAAYSVSANGVLVFYSGEVLPTEFRWFDRMGRPGPAVGTPGMHTTMAMESSGHRVVFGRRDSAAFNQNLWVMDVARNVTTRLTFGANRDSDGTWSPDGLRVAFASVRQGVKSLYEIPSAGGAERLLLRQSDGALSMDAWSPDGRLVLYHVDVRRELRALPLDGDQKSFLVVKPASGVVDEPSFSPDGKWLAYNSSESGRFEVYTIPFPPTGARWQVSANGGGQPRWRGDGKELFFLSPDGTMMAVEIKAGATIEPGTPHALFKTNLQTSFTTDQYAVMNDGQRFLLMKPVSDTIQTPMTVVLNWTAALKK
jgi:eukaryotic-like serine/threonine-protein kinase